MAFAISNQRKSPMAFAISAAPADCTAPSLLHCSDGTWHSRLKSPISLALPLWQPEIANELGTSPSACHMSLMHEVATPTCDLHAGYVQKQHPLGKTLKKTLFREIVSKWTPNWEICLHEKQQKLGKKIEWKRRRTQTKTISQINNKIQQQQEYTINDNPKNEEQ